MVAVPDGACPRGHGPPGQRGAFLHRHRRVRQGVGGGVVRGSLVLIGGDPGIGKSTLLLQMAMALAEDRVVLYVSGEESALQIKARAARLTEKAAGSADHLYLITETNVERILEHTQSLNPAVVIVDSIQTAQVPEFESAAGSVSQVRESAARLQAMAKMRDVAVFLVGHVTKEGAIAGPRVLEHIVDTVLYLEGDAFHSIGNSRNPISWLSSRSRKNWI